MNKIEIIDYIYVEYPGDGGRRRKMAVVVCPGCNSKKTFRNHEIPNSGWLCRECYTKQHRAIKYCSHCGKVVNRPKSKLNRSKTGYYFCNRLCKESEQTYTGILSLPHFLGKEDTKRQVFANNNGKCGLCDVSEPYLLVIHHKDKDRTNNSIDNLELLCHNHHAEKHKKLLNGVWVLDYKQIFE